MELTITALRLAVISALASAALGQVGSYLQIYPPVDANDTREPLYFGLIQSFGGEFDGSGSIAGVEVALDEINSDLTILPGYSLHYTLTDSQVSHVETVMNCLINRGCHATVSIIAHFVGMN